MSLVGWWILIDITELNTLIFPLSRVSMSLVGWWILIDITELNTLIFPLSRVSMSLVGWWILIDSLYVLKITLVERFV